MNHTIITLVHGTFAPEAEWTQPDSFLCSSLGERVHDATFIRFQWSGKNTFRARQKATEDLQLFLRRTFSKFPTADHFVVGHSHGGTVALQALQDPILQARTKGLVCLSTPFFHVKKRNLGSNSEAIIHGAAIIPALVLAIGFSLFKYINYLEETGFWKLMMYLMIAALPFFILLEAVKSSAEKFISNWKTCSIPKDKLLIIRVVGDEASGGLGAAHFFGWLMTSIWLMGRNFLERANAKAQARRRAFKPFALFIGIASAAVFAFGSVLHSTGWNPGVGDRLATIGSLIGSCLLAAWLLLLFAVNSHIKEAVPSLMLLPLMFIVGLFLFPFGPEVVLACVLVEITCETTPVGNWECHLFSENQKRQPGLMHSLAYDDERACSVIRDWINGVKCA